VRDVKEAAVRDALFLVPWRPRVEVGVEMDDRDRPIDLVQRAKDGENDGVVATEAGT
jgi:hypothetical protein